MSGMGSFVDLKPASGHFLQVHREDSKKKVLRYTTKCCQVWLSGLEFLFSFVTSYSPSCSDTDSTLEFRNCYCYWSS